MGDLAAKHCVPCEAGGAPLSRDEAVILLEKTDQWSLSPDARVIRKDFMFPDFKTAMVFADHIAALAEEEGHHPALGVSWGKVVVELTTHAMHGLSANDFILAAKIDEIPRT